LDKNEFEDDNINQLTFIEKQNCCFGVKSAHFSAFLHVKMSPWVNFGNDKHLIEVDPEENCVVPAVELF
jgi:hypothetical protein